jgi:hypothetical protein
MRARLGAAWLILIANVGEHANTLAAAALAVPLGPARAIRRSRRRFSALHDRKLRFALRSADRFAVRLPL